jgi:hypothetical protein
LPCCEAGLNAVHRCGALRGPGHARPTISSIDHGDATLLRGAAVSVRHRRFDAPVVGGARRRVEAPVGGGARRRVFSPVRIEKRTAFRGRVSGRTAGASARTAHRQAGSRHRK